MQKTAILGQPWRRTPSDTIGARFANQPNALNVLRLVFASAVILWHADGLVHDPDRVSRAVTDIAGYLPVDGFFAISGFLIVSSWERRPHLGRFLEARARRLLPGLWTCLALTAFVIVPITSHTSLRARASYLMTNLGVFITQPGIDGTPGPLHRDSWNGSLATLWWELCCYLGVAVFGVAGLLWRRWFVAVTFSGCLLLALSLVVLDNAVPLAGLFVPASRFFLMFSAGALLWRMRHHVPATRLAALVAFLLLAGGTLLPNYRLLAAPAIAYLCIYLGTALGRYRRLVFKTDISYGVYVYGWPIQTTLILSGFPAERWALFAACSLALVYPLATLSWFLVERPAMRWARRPSIVEPLPGGDTLDRAVEARAASA